MFSELQVRKIKYFATVSKITNECFKVCVNLPTVEEGSDLSKIKTDIDWHQLNKNEMICLKSCSENYMKLREFIEGQLFEDYESIKNKNKKILDDET